MMKTFLPPTIVALLALAVPGSAQDRTGEPARIGLDISRIEGAAPAPAIPVAKPAKPDKKPSGPVEITAQEATYDNRTNIAIFIGEVVVHHPEFGLSSDRLTLTINASLAKGPAQPPTKPKADDAEHKGPPEAGSDKLEKAVAEGHVTITQDKPDGNGVMQRYTGKGSRAVYDSKANTLKLYGWPQISQGVIGGGLSKQIIAREEGCVITLDRAGKIDVKGYHTSTLHDAADLNQKPR